MYVFVKDRTEYPGASRPLKTKLSPSPYVVLRVLHTTVLVRRIADSFTSLYSMDDVKKYDSTSPLFAYIPKEVRKVLLHDFEDLLTDDFCTITKYDKLDPPEGIPLTTKYQQKRRKRKKEAKRRKKMKKEIGKEGLEAEER